MNNDGAGATQVKTGDLACAIDRGIGYTKTMKASDNKTRSHYKGTSKHNQWEGAGSGTGGNMLGWGKHGGGGSHHSGY